jgi:hypothetical protein
MDTQEYGVTNSYAWDEIRIGYSWEQVTPNYIIKNVQASDGEFTNKVTISWTTRSDAEGYTVYRSQTDDSSTASAISGELTSGTYDDTTASPGTVYFYWIKGRFTDGTESFSYSDSGYRAVAGAPDAPQNVAASDGVADQSYVQVAWDAVSGGGIVYRIYRNKVDDYASSEAVSSDISATMYLDSAVAPGVRY